MANSNEPKEGTDQNDDLITLTGMNKISTWRFPSNLKECPSFRCGFESKIRSAMLAHYRTMHAASSVYCFLCKKPISVKGNIANYRRHFKRMHPHVKLSLAQYPKDESSSQSNLKFAPPSKHFVKAQSIAKQSNHNKKMCKVCGLKFRNLSRHIIEMHTTKRILCPLKSCEYTSKRLDHIRIHWKSVHQNFRFPEIDQNSGFTYKTTTADTQECVNS